MYILTRYIIRKQFIYMYGFYDRNGKMYTLIKETRKTFIVDKTPLDILDDSIRQIGFNLSGAMKTSKLLLGNVHHCPVLVNPIQRIVVFPTRSALHEECVWFNPVHIKRTTSRNRKTHIMFSNGKAFHFPAKLSAFNCKIKRAEQLEEMTKDTFYIILNESHSRIRKRKNRK